MAFAEACNDIFESATALYHRYDNIDAHADNPYPADSIEHALFAKHWVDAVQWHLEDIIRDPAIAPDVALMLKRRIDRSNQQRIDIVEHIDGYFMEKYHGVKPLHDATINTESPAWAIDRLSILALKIYHMQQETERHDSDELHRKRCAGKLAILLEQRDDLTTAINQLLDDIAAGKKLMKAYYQMKMYNDPDTNPVLYAKQG